MNRNFLGLFSIIGSEDPKDYITKKRPKTDSHGAYLTQDMPMITLYLRNFGAAGLCKRLMRNLQNM